MQKVEFLRILELIKALANVLDQDVPSYKIEEDKSKKSVMSVSKKPAVSGASGAARSAASQAKDAKVTNQFAPFNDEFEKDFYAVLPDLQRFVDQPTELESSLDGVSEEQLAEIYDKAEQELQALSRLLSKSQSKD